MTRIQFFHGAPDRAQAAASWLAAAHARGDRVIVYVPDAARADQLDRLLWTHPPTGFLPHCRAGEPLAEETPVIIDRTLEAACRDECLLNLSDELPPGFARFREVVEIVSREEPVVRAARERFRFFRDRGYELANEDISQGFT
ncbi:MAG: DNA polymerase III subunit chi [Rhodocyclaceae bacterium]|nr:DNA polymerase III subunit chi [Rhodocyclaceae bacterium]